MNTVKQSMVSWKNEKGMVLVVALLVMAVLVILGTTAVMTTTTDLKISGNQKTGTQAFYIAEAGIEHARAQLRNIGSSTLTDILTDRCGADGSLSDSTDIVNFYANGTFIADDDPYISQTSFGGGTYRVYLTNDPSEGVTNASDSNEKVTLTSFGKGSNNSFAVVQTVVKKFTMPPIPGAITLPGSGVSFEGGNSNASSVDGSTESAIATTSSASNTAVINQLTSIGRIGNYTCNNPPCINDESSTIHPTWNSVSGLESLYNQLESMADVVTGSTAITTTLTAGQVGTTSDRKIVVVNGDAVLGPVNGAGILVVTGQLTLSGNFNYQGVILCIGEGNLLRNGGGNGVIEGAIIVAQTRDSSNNLLSSLGTSTFHTNGGGNTDIIYNGSETTNPTGMRFIKDSWKQF